MTLRSNFEINKGVTVKSSERYLIEAVEVAQRMAREKGLALGSTVCHPDDDHIYILRETNGNIATVKTSVEHSPGEKEITKEFPLDELFELNTAKGVAFRIAKRKSYLSFLAHAMNKNFH